jgi:hypothetical protein
MACGNPGHREVAAVQRYKFQGLLTVDPPPEPHIQSLKRWGLAYWCDSPSSWRAVQAAGAGVDQPGQLGQGLFGGHV